MKAKEFLKPAVLKMLIFLFIAVFFLYFATESVCGASFYFAFCYKAYGFPFSHTITGDIDSASSYVRTLFLGEYFNKSKNFLFSPIALIFDAVLAYLLACLLSMLLKNAKIKT